MAISENDNLSLEEIISELRQIGVSEDRMQRVKDVESVKSAFYRTLGNLKAEAEAAGEDVAAKFDEVERTFKSVLADYKRERAEYTARQEAERQLNLERKKSIIEELRKIVEGSIDDVGQAFPRLRELQASWRETGMVPAGDAVNINSTYQHLVETFYDMVEINHELRDLDFKKNLEAKEALCDEAEKLAEDPDIVASFNALQKLHDRWKEYGPVAKDLREPLWERFKAATAVVNRKYQDFFEVRKAREQENLAQKTALCEELEAVVASSETFATGTAWNAAARQVEDIQTRWRKIGFASRKDNQKIYERMRSSCDTFFERRKAYFTAAKSSMEANEAVKEDLVAQAEALKTSTDWKETTEKLIALQARWKETGPVPHRKSEELWKRFRAACDEFFAERDRNARPDNNFYANLKSKKQIIAEILAYEPKDGENSADACASFTERFNSIGFVPFKEKDAVAKSFRDAIRAKFPDAGPARRTDRRPERKADPRQEMLSKYRALQQDITTKENNIGFFSSKNTALLDMMQKSIDDAKAELKALEQRIREVESASSEE